MTIGSALLVIANCGVIAFPVFHLIKDYVKAKKPDLSIDKEISKSQPQQNQSDKSCEEIQPKVTSGEKYLIKSKDNSVIISPRKEDPEIPPEFTSEIRIGKIVSHTRKESIDNFSIMQSSGAGLLSPYHTSSISGLRSPYCISSISSLLSPIQTSSTLIKLPASKETIIVKKADLTQKTPRQKKIDLKRINMKQFVVDEMKLKSEGPEKNMTEMIITEKTEPAASIRTQEDNE